jgi:hypothetical protein
LEGGTMTDSLYDNADAIDTISDIFREIFDTEIIIVKAINDGERYVLSCPGFCVKGQTKDMRLVEFDPKKNTIIHNGKTMEFNDETLEYLKDPRNYRETPVEEQRLLRR